MGIKACGFSSGWSQTPTTSANLLPSSSWVEWTLLLDLTKYDLNVLVDLQGMQLSHKSAKVNTPNFYWALNFYFSLKISEPEKWVWHTYPLEMPIEVLCKSDGPACLQSLLQIVNYNNNDSLNYPSCCFFFSVFQCFKNIILQGYTDISNSSGSSKL